MTSLLLDTLSLTGRSREQVDEFLSSVVAPIRTRYGTATTSADAVRA